MSWIIVEEKTKRAVFETFDKRVALRVNTEKYKVLTAMEYLQSLNERS